MKYRELGIRTLREAPVKSRASTDALLARAGYFTAKGELTPLGEIAIAHLKRLASRSQDFLTQIGLSFLSIVGSAIVHTCTEGDFELLQCSKCGYAAATNVARYRFSPPKSESPLPLRRLPTPGCNTIPTLTAFLGVQPNRTAKALMYVRPSDDRFVFVVIRGDKQISERKLQDLSGLLEPASAARISQAGAVAGYASAIGLKDALIVADEQIVESANLVAGANEAGFHLENTNYGRDYQAEVIGDLTLASPGDPCPDCGEPLANVRSYLLRDPEGYQFGNVMRALADQFHDERGLCWPAAAAPFNVYLIHLPSKAIDTAGRADELYQRLEASGVPVLYDDRDERAGVKFNDADLIGLPLRLTVGERGLQHGMIEFKARRAEDIRLVPLTDVTEAVLAEKPVL